jgi:hypothetical protein
MDVKALFSVRVLYGILNTFVMPLVTWKSVHKWLISLMIEAKLHSD